MSSRGEAVAFVIRALLAGRTDMAKLPIFESMAYSLAGLISNLIG